MLRLIKNSRIIVSFLLACFWGLCGSNGLISLLFAQPFTLIKQRTLGGESSDISAALLPLEDGVLLGGYSWSGKRGDKTDTLRNRFTPDIWLTQLDKENRLLWQKTYGGGGTDILKTMIRLKDGNILLAGSSTSDKGFEKSQNNRGLFDYWLLKISPSGKVIWDKTLGGTRNDILVTVLELENGEILVGGDSFSSATGDKTSPNLGESDIWICKLSPAGDILWQRSWGGAHIEQLAAIEKNDNGAFILLATTYSDSSAFLVDSSYGGADLWLAEFSANGEFLGQKRIGGAKNDIAAGLLAGPSGDIFVLAASNSDSGYHKSENARGDFDYWFLRLSSNFEITAQKTLGGIQPDYPITFCKSAPNALLSIVGYSYSNAGFEKTEPRRGQEDIWALTLDWNGKILEEKTFGGNASDRPAACYLTSDGKLRLAAYSNSGKSYEKNDTSRGLEDYWLLTLQSSALSRENLISLQEANFILYPNPAENKVYIRAAYPIKEAQITITDAAGKKWRVNEHYFEQNELELNLNLPPGLYFAQINYGQVIEHKKFIIR
jgi:hypothetical protein